MKNIVAIRGGGDLASGIALRLIRSGFLVLVLEIEKPLVVRRKVAFAEAVFQASTKVEEIEGILAGDIEGAIQIMAQGKLPVLVSPEDNFLISQDFPVIVDARMLKKEVTDLRNSENTVIGIGPGFQVDENCHAIIESKRGHHLGRVLHKGRAAANTGIPGSIEKINLDRVIRAPSDGFLTAHREIGALLKQGDMIGEMGQQTISAPFDGILRGLIHSSVELTQGMKIGDLDPRSDPSYVDQVSDKALAIGGGVLEIILSQLHLRNLIINA